MNEAIPAALLIDAIVAVVTVVFISFFSGLLSGVADIIVDLLRRKLKLEKPKNNED